MQEYNAQGKVVRSTDLAGRVTTTGRARRPFRHARRGKKIANSATVHYSLLPIRCPDSTPSVVLCYDAMGRQTRAVDAAGVTTFAYDSFGSLTNETVVGVAGTNTIERFYDAFGRDAGYALNGVRQSTLAYDPVTGRLSTMRIGDASTNWGCGVLAAPEFSWNYLANSDLKSSLAYPNGLTVSWTYGNRGELLEVNNALADGSISKYDYTYDAVGRRIACAKSGTAFEQSDSVNYGYNARSELTSATAAVDTAYRYGYNFDDIGNRKTSAERGTNSVYTASQLNQYTAVDDFTPTYDADGNETIVKTATGIWNVTYNGENRPVRWTQGDTVITMSFDRMGRRVTKNDQRFVYNGYLQIADNSGNTYVWDCTENVATRPLVWQRSALGTQHSTLFYTHDGNKNVSEVIDSNNDVAAHYVYAPFGALTVSRGASAADNPWRFSSEYAEDDTATVYYNYRHYEPEAGRWMGRDPVFDDVSECMFCYNQLGVIDFLGLYRMVSRGSIFKDTYAVDAKLILEKINFLNAMVDALGQRCYIVELRDLEYASIEDINRASKDAIVFVIGHGKIMHERFKVGMTSFSWWGKEEPVVGFAKNNGDFIPLRRIKVDAQNLFGCFISPRVRNQKSSGFLWWEKHTSMLDDYNVMFKNILKRHTSEKGMLFSN